MRLRRRDLRAGRHQHRTTPAGAGSPTPINPDGSLVNCVPPASPVAARSRRVPARAAGPVRRVDLRRADVDGGDHAGGAHRRRGAGRSAICWSRARTSRRRCRSSTSSTRAWRSGRDGNRRASSTTPRRHLRQRTSRSPLRNPDSSADQTLRARSGHALRCAARALVARPRRSGSRRVRRHAPARRFLRARSCRTRSRSTCAAPTSSDAAPRASRSCGGSARRSPSSC